jgi:hypothetical protein
VEEIISAINHALDCCSHSLNWYSITGEERYMVECKEWQSVAGYYMNQLIMEQKSETCESTD